MNHLPPSSNSIPGPALPPLVWGQAHLRATVGATQPWLWQGYLAPATVTLLTGRWKAGKTTLLSVLLARKQIRVAGRITFNNGRDPPFRPSLAQRAGQPANFRPPVGRIPGRARARRRR
jgi:hypothetical protein